MLHPLLFWIPGYGDAIGGIPVVSPVIFSATPDPLFCWPVWSGVSYGGSWRDKLPVGNMGTNELEDFARSSDLTYASTKMRRDLLHKRRVRVVSIPKSNITMSAQYRVTAANSDAALDSAPVYQSAWLSAWPDLLDPESPTARNYNIGTIHFIPSDLDHVDAQFWQIEWADSGNPDGVLDVHLVQFANAYAPAKGMSVGASVGILDRSTVTESIMNTAFVTPGHKQRFLNVAFDLESESEAFTNAFEMQTDFGITQPFQFIFDRNDDPRARAQRSFLARFSELSPTEWSSSLYLKNGYKISEWL